MCDVLHAMFEEDYTPHFAEEIDVKGRLRESLYESLYGEAYGWRVNGAQSDVPPDAGPVHRAPRSLGAPRSGIAASAVNPETGTMDLPEGTKYADPNKVLRRVPPASSMEDLAAALGTPLG